jgi:hypothetical protein
MKNFPLVALSISVAVCAQFSEAQAARLRGRCISRITGTAVAFVYGGTYAELMSNCRKQVNDPIVDNVTVLQADPPPPNAPQASCHPASTDPKCEVGKELIPTRDFPTCGGTEYRAGVTSGVTVSIDEHHRGRSCVTVPANFPITGSVCKITTSQGELDYCSGFSNGSGPCPYANTRHLTQYIANGRNTICWTVENQTHSREFTLFVY